jgi:hypothetical protein
MHVLARGHACPETSKRSHYTPLPVQVEGHDWWPARVVRRRAVPREVGPPPGGPARVRTHSPVVFFTARGIPGENLDAKPPGAAPGVRSSCFLAMEVTSNYSIIPDSYS